MGRRKVKAETAAYIKVKYAEAPTMETKKQLAKELHMSLYSVGNVLDGRYELTRRFRALTEEDKEAIVSNPNKCTQEELASLYGVSSTHIAKVVSGKIPVKKAIDPNIFSWVNNPAFF